MVLPFGAVRVEPPSSRWCARIILNLYPQLECVRLGKVLEAERIAAACCVAARAACTATRYVYLPRSPPWSALDPTKLGAASLLSARRMRRKHPGRSQLPLTPMLPWTWPRIRGCTCCIPFFAGAKQRRVPSWRQRGTPQEFLDLETPSTRSVHRCHRWNGRMT